MNRQMEGWWQLRAPIVDTKVNSEYWTLLYHQWRTISHSGCFKSRNERSMHLHSNSRYRYPAETGPDPIRNLELSVCQNTLL